MNQLDRDPRLSALYDGEAGAEPFATGHKAAESKAAESKAAGAETAAEVAKLLRFFRRLSALLRVPADVGESDPNFIARFRARRDALRDAMAASARWRWLTLRLVPLTAASVLVTGVVLWASSSPPSAIEALEVHELGDGIGHVAADTATDEPVLRIAFGDL